MKINNIQNRSRQQSSTSFTQKFTVQEILYAQKLKQTMLVVDKQENKKYIVRKFNMDHLENQQLEKLIKMMKQSSKISHQNLINYKYSLIEDNHIFCVFENQVANFKKILEALFPFGIQSWSLLKNLLRQVVNGLEILHENQIVHRNLSSERIFVNKEGLIKLDYFGHFCTEGGQNKSNFSIYGNLSSVAPELLQEETQGYSAKSDIYAFGALCYELMMGHKIFQNQCIHEAISCIFQTDISFPKSFKKIFPQKFVKLVQDCLAKDPRKRPDIQCIKRFLGKERSQSKNQKIILQKIVSRFYNVSLIEIKHEKHNTLQLTYKNYL